MGDVTDGNQVTTWSPAKFAGPIDCNLLPGTILRGSNIAPKAAHVATGHAFRALFAEWDWAGWIKPQVDALAALGGNTVRLIGDFEGVNDATFTQSYYNGCWTQLIEYAATLSMTTYPALGGVSQIAAAGLDAAGIVATVEPICAHLDTLVADVVGIDVIQESVRADVASSWALGSGATISAAVRAVTGIPITYSFSDNSDRTGRFQFPLWRHHLRDHVDFWDIHIYGSTPPALIFDAFWGQGESMPVVIGEFGAPASDGEAEQTRIYEGVEGIVTNRRHGLHVAGALSWTIFDQGAGSAAYGMCETNGTPRTHVTDVFERLPTA